MPDEKVGKSVKELKPDVKILAHWQFDNKRIREKSHNETLYHCTEPGLECVMPTYKHKQAWYICIY